MNCKTFIDYRLFVIFIRQSLHLCWNFYWTFKSVYKQPKINCTSVSNLTASPVKFCRSDGFCLLSTASLLWKIKSWVNCLIPVSSYKHIFFSGSRSFKKKLVYARENACDLWIWQYIKSLWEAVSFQYLQKSTFEVTFKVPQTLF